MTKNILPQSSNPSNAGHPAGPLSRRDLLRAAFLVAFGTAAGALVADVRIDGERLAEPELQAALAMAPLLAATGAPPTTKIEQQAADLLANALETAAAHWGGCLSDAAERRLAGMTLAEREVEIARLEELAGALRGMAMGNV